MNKKNLLLKSLYLSFLLLSISFSSILFHGCSDQKPKFDDEKNSMHSIPVKVQIIEYQKFNKILSFYCTLSGIKETTKGAMVSDKVEKIFFKPGDKIYEKQIVLKFPTDNPTLQFEQAKTNYESLQKTYNRMKELLKKGEISQQNFDNIEAQYLVAKRNFESIKQILFVEAPISGILSNLFVTEGQQVEVRDPLFTISVLNKVRAIVWANEKEILNIKNGMSAKIFWNNMEFNAKIESVSLKMDPKMKGFRVDIVAENPKLILKSGITVQVFIPIYENPNAIVLPKTLIQYSYDKREFVYVVENGKARQRFIKLGDTNSGLVEVIDGLKPNEKVIIEGYDNIFDGAVVNVTNN
ncbi:MAG: efflux RND transporter periplasmic adaptor subunit [Candidatus Kapaibacteriales bacterium]